MEWIEWSRLIASLLPGLHSPSVSKLPSADCQPPSTPMGHSFNPLENLQEKYLKIFDRPSFVEKNLLDHGFEQWRPRSTSRIFLIYLGKTYFLDFPAEGDFRLLRRNNQPHFKDRDAKLRTFRNTFAKNMGLTIEFNRFFDNVLSFSPQFLQIFFWQATFRWQISEPQTTPVQK